MPEPQRISVIIPTLGRSSLAQCLAAVRNQTRPPEEVVVVEDRNRQGVAWARNEGIRRSTGQLVAFTDDDCVPPPEWLEQLEQALTLFEVPMAGGLFVEADRFHQEIRARRYRRTNRQAPREVQLDTASIAGSGGSVMYRRSELDRCSELDGHVFNEAFPMSQDWELASRLRARGARFAAIPATVLHARFMGPTAYLVQQFNRGRGIAQLYRAHRAGRLVVAQPSLLWGVPGSRQVPRWGRSLWMKLIGPFDRSSFSSWRHFMLFWAGEKLQGAGFLWSRVRPGPGE